MREKRRNFFISNFIRPRKNYVFEYPRVIWRLRVLLLLYVYEIHASVI